MSIQKLDRNSGQSVETGDAISPIIQAVIAKHILNREFKAALGILLPLLGQNQTHPQLLDETATCFWNLGDQTSALGLIRVLSDLRPDDATVWNKYGAMAVSCGDSDTGKMAFSRALRLHPKSANTLAALNAITPFTRSSRQAGILKQLAQSRKTANPDRAAAFNALGRIEERAGNFPVAFRMYSQAKAVNKGVYQPAAFERHLDSQLRLFQPEKMSEFSNYQNPRARFVFVVGLPRSGTTLVENMLTRHRDVTTIGEDAALQTTLKRCRNTISRRHGPMGTWDWISHITPDDIADLRRYFTDLTADATTGEKYVVNKLPLNCLELGFASLLLPDAAFIFMARHPLDVGLSNFCTNFHATHAFSRKLEWIAHLTRIVYSSVDDYASKLGPSLRLQSYRALVQSPDPQARLLLEHLGLDWDAECLSPQLGQKIVRTASLTQVRRAINTDGLDKWKQYERQLQPLVEALGGWNWISDWEEHDLNRAET